MILLIALAYPLTIVVLFYLAFLRPVQQESKRARNEIANLEIGERALTQAGFIATVKDFEVPERGGQTEILLELAPGVVVRAVGQAIRQRLEPAPQPELPQKRPQRVSNAPQS